MPEVTRTFDSWNPRDQHVERLLDNAAYTAAHPDDTLLLAGPARWLDAFPENDVDTVGSVLPIGMMQQFQIAQNTAVSPIPSIGTSRHIFTRSKTPVNWSMSRLWCNGRNLLRTLYHNAVVAGLDPSTLPEPGAAVSGSQTYLNLDSELFFAPFGLMMVFRDRSRNPLGAYYLECCSISSWNLGVAAGTSMIASNVSGMADRVVPVDFTTTSIQSSLDAINSFVDDVATDATYLATS